MNQRQYRAPAPGLLRLAIVTVIILSGVSAVAFGDDSTSTAVISPNEEIAQVDASHLLTRQRVDVYVSVTDQTGSPVENLSAGNFSMFEGLPEGKLQPVPSFTLHRGVEPNAGITFFLLVDNSGSMYQPVDDNAPAGGQTRIGAAKDAIRTFLNSVTNPNDRIGLATLNTYYRPEILPQQSHTSVEDALAEIKRPASEGAYTELYASLQAAARNLAGWKGRKVIILLTDGENYPYAVYSGKPSPQFGSHVVASDEAIQSLIRQGISVFPVHFGPGEQDANLKAIARNTGGRLFEASSEQQLTGVYLSVRSRVLREYRLTYAPRMIPGDRRIVKVDYNGPGGASSASQLY